MVRLSRIAIALSLGVSVGPFPFVVVSSTPKDQAVAMHSVPAPAHVETPVTVPLTSTGPATFKIAFPPSTATFIIMLTDTVRLHEARDIVSGVETEATSVMGTIIKAPAPYNPPWSYHLDPASISFFAFAIEVCDAAPQYVEEHLSEVGGALLPGSIWCPWSSRVAEEVEAHAVFLPIVGREATVVVSFP
jgi:hypothetical protein